MSQHSQVWSGRAGDASDILDGHSGQSGRGGLCPCMATKLLASIRPVLWPLLLCHLPSISSKSAHFEVIEKHTDPFCKWGRVILFWDTSRTQSTGVPTHKATQRP